MTSPIKSAVSGIGNFFGAPNVINAVGRAFTPPGSGGAPVPNVPAPPPLAPPESQPTAKPAKKGIQSSFLSGVAGAGLAGGQSGSQVGKSLLGQ